MANVNTAAGKGVAESQAQSTPKSCLVDKVIKLRPVPVRRTPFIVGADRDRVRSEQIMLTGTSRSIILLKDGVSNRFVDPLTLSERLFLEDALGVNLDVNKPKDNFYNEVRIVLTKTTDDLDQVYTELDLSNPLGYLMYKICLVSPEVAHQRKERYSGQEIYFLDDEIVEVTQERDENKDEDDCYKFLYSIEERKDKLYNFLRTFNLLNKTRKYVDKNATTEWLYNELKNLIRYRETRGRVHSLVELIKKDEASYEMKLFIQDALEIGEIKYSSTDAQYTTAMGEPLGRDVKEVEDYLRNPVNQLKREYIKNQIKAQLK